VGADVVVGVSVAILVVLFSVQRFGTDKVGYSFAPAILLWFICIPVFTIHFYLTLSIELEV
jgi:KUP system potassium uptake protein